MVIIGFFKDQTSDEAKKFLTVASITDDQQFGITSDETVFGEYEAKCGNVILFKKVRRNNFVRKSVFDKEFAWDFPYT